jgi:hypothetical protein
MQTDATRGGSYDESIAWGWPTLVEVADSWVLERVHYDWDNLEDSESTGHFTAMVWKATTEIGCARSFP